MKPTFAEDLPKADFAGRLHEYPMATAKEKASDRTEAHCVLVPRTEVALCRLSRCLHELKPMMGHHPTWSSAVCTLYISDVHWGGSAEGCRVWPLTNAQAILSLSSRQSRMAQLSTANLGFTKSLAAKTSRYVHRMQRSQSMNAYHADI